MIDENDKAKDVTEFAFYPDIKSIDTVYYAGATYSPYLLVNRSDGSNFKVSVDGKRSEIKAFFEEASNQPMGTKQKCEVNVQPSITVKKISRCCRDIFRLIDVFLVSENNDTCLQEQHQFLVFHKFYMPCFTATCYYRQRIHAERQVAGRD